MEKINNMKILNCIKFLILKILILYIYSYIVIKYIRN